VQKDNGVLVRYGAIWEGGANVFKWEGNSRLSCLLQMVQ